MEGVSIFSVAEPCHRVQDIPLLDTHRISTFLSISIAGKKLVCVVHKVPGSLPNVAELYLVPVLIEGLITGIEIVVAGGSNLAFRILYLLGLKRS
jgi:hypothetical protein